MPHWEERAAYGGQKGIVNIGAIRGGYPWRASRTPESTDVFLDLRVPPTMPLQQARSAVQAICLRICSKTFPDYGLGCEIYVSVPGAEITRRPRNGEDD